jgi:hypothetical protein
VTISNVEGITVEDWWRNAHHLTKGTNAAIPHSSATNWDPFSSHELVINLACTTVLADAATDPAYETDS